MAARSSSETMPETISSKGFVTAMTPSSPPSSLTASPMTEATGSASTLSPYLYAQIGFAMLCGWVAFAHVPGPTELAGMALIVACGVTASWINARAAAAPRSA